MGEAKRRGSLEARTQDALARLRAALPDSVKCNNCGAELHEILPLDVQGMAGMRAAGVAVCASCSHDTWAIDGTPDALRKFQQFLEDEQGGAAVSTGIARKAT